MCSSSSASRDDYEWVYFPPLVDEAVDYWLIFWVLLFIVSCENLSLLYVNLIIYTVKLSTRIKQTHIAREHRLGASFYLGC